MKRAPKISSIVKFKSDLLKFNRGFYDGVGGTNLSTTPTPPPHHTVERL